MRIIGTHMTATCFTGELPGLVIIHGCTPFVNRYWQGCLHPSMGSFQASLQDISFYLTLTALTVQCGLSNRT